MAPIIQTSFEPRITSSHVQLGAFACLEWLDVEIQATITPKRHFFTFFQIGLKNKEFKEKSNSFFFLLFTFLIFLVEIMSSLETPQQAGMLFLLF